MRTCDFKLITVLLQLYFHCIAARTNNESVIVNGSIAKPHPKGRKERINCFSLVITLKRLIVSVCIDVRITIFEVRRGLDIQSLASCEIILGSIIYAPMPTTNNTANSSAVAVRFPYLREVYGYMLLGYSSHRSFATMFPRLAIIHGRELYHGYALIIMENLQLDDLGLTSLINIRRGNVIIARNAQLCYAQSIQWNEIIENKKAQVILRQNRDDCAFCPTCPFACWSPTVCQQQCSANCKGNCFSENQCCPEDCVGGCYYSNVTSASTNQLICNACRKMRIYATGQCVERCPSHMLKVRTKKMKWMNYVLMKSDV